METERVGATFAGLSVAGDPYNYLISGRGARLLLEKSAAADEFREGRRVPGAIKAARGHKKDIERSKNFTRMG